MIHATGDDAANAFRLVRCARVVDDVQGWRGKVRVEILRGCIASKLIKEESMSYRRKNLRYRRFALSQLKWEGAKSHPSCSVLGAAIAKMNV